MNQPALWADPLWTDAYVVSQPIHDGVRDGIVSAILEDCSGGLGGIGLVVRYPDGHETTFGYDHMLSDAAESSDGPGACGPGPTSGDGSPGPVPATGDAVAVERAASVPVAGISTNEETPELCPQPGA